MFHKIRLIMGNQIEEIKINQVKTILNNLQPAAHFILIVLEL